MNTNKEEQAPIVNEVFADNGAHSHWELVNPQNGQILWSEGEQVSNDAVEALREKVKNCSDKTKEDRARKGAYVDVICILQSLQPTPVEGEK
ncbi:MAG: hypothetical protein JWO92_2530 [Chitinophagaceae bacterium]|nr:hypothetical protein [Chitinophagaceae bacterium]